MSMNEFFEALKSRLAGASAVQAQMDRRLAARFNVFDYLRTDELGLSRIIADLLDPRGAHGQGTLFLGEFLKLLKAEECWSRFDWDPSAASVLEQAAVGVETERTTPEGRRVDISVEVRLRGAGPLCVGIENKPYAGDGRGQVGDYLAFLRAEYGTQYLLIYLTPDGRDPSDWSLAAEADRDGLATLSYVHAADREEGRNPTRLHFTLADWLRACRAVADVDRLRWFLRDAEAFWNKRFGGGMDTDSERAAVRDLILASDDNVRAAIAVADGWKETSAEVVRKFLARLQGEVRQRLGGSVADLVVKHDFNHRHGNDGLWVHREAWTWGDEGGAVPTVWLCHYQEGNDANARWYIGVCLEGVTDMDDGAFDQLHNRLMGAPGLSDGSKFAGWPWYRYLDDEHDRLVALLARLWQEAEAPQPGELTTYLADQFVEVASIAIPEIDKVLGTE